MSPMESVPQAILEIKAVEEVMGRIPSREFDREFNNIIYKLRINPAESTEHSLRAEQLSRILMKSNGAPPDKIFDMHDLFKELRYYIDISRIAACDMVLDDLEKLFKEFGQEIAAVI